MPASSETSCATVTHGDKKKKHRFQPQFHHPVIHWAQHVTSPLTAALFIFFMHKSWQHQSMAATLRGALVLLRNNEWSFHRHIKGTVFVTLGCAAVCVAKKYAPAPFDHDPQHNAALKALYEMEDVQHVNDHLSRWWTTSYVDYFFHYVHNTVGLPWWATIVSVTIALRIALIPVNILLLQNSLRMKIILPKIHKLGDILKTSKDPAEKLDAARRLRHLFDEHKCSPWGQTFVFPILLPATILSIFGAVHNMSMAEKEMATEGTLWFVDLVDRDKTMLLPIISALTWLTQIELGAGVHYAARPTLRLAARLTTVATISLSSTLPAGVFVFWITSNLFAIARALVVSRDPVRRLLGIPLASEIKKLRHLPRRRGW